jgi:hypothetical protein
MVLPTSRPSSSATVKLTTTSSTRSGSARRPSRILNVLISVPMRPSSLAMPVTPVGPSGSSPTSPSAESSTDGSALISSKPPTPGTPGCAKSTTMTS